MKKIVFLLLLLNVCLACDRKKYDIYLLIGQSNMAGRGEVLPEDFTPITGVYLLNSNGDIVQASAPLNQYSTIRKKMSMQGYSLGLSFAETMHCQNGRPVLLVVNARGGSRLEQWEKGSGGYLFSKNDGDDEALWGTEMPSFYDEAIRRTLQACKYGKLKAILWHQGESDYIPGRAETYTERFSGFVANLRSALGSVPIVVGEVNYAYKGASIINPILRLTAEQIPDCICVSAEGCPAKADSTHFNRAGCILLGQRYAEALY